MAVLAVGGLLGAAACGNDDSDSGSSGDNGDITLVIDVFGEQGFGYDALYAQFEEEHGVTIQERGRGLGVGDYDDRLFQQIIAGEGAGDVVALEDGTIPLYYAQLERFVNLADHGLDARQADFPDWKWDKGVVDDFVLGLGTDVGSMALCYRGDLFEEAGLPGDRDEVSALYDSWEDFLEVGRDFAAAGTDASFLDAATNFFNAVSLDIAGGSSGYTYFDLDDNLDVDNPDLRTTWDLTIEMIESDLSANLNTFSDEWNAGIQQSQFAAVACPAWLAGVIQGGADGAVEPGLWDIADAPGSGGNWGGSWLAVPAETDHPELAAELVNFLSSPEAHIVAFEELGNLPSTLEGLASEEVQESTNEYFSDAPAGAIFAAGVEEFRAVHFGPQHEAVRAEFEGALQAVEQGEMTPDEAWEAATSNAQLAAGG
ncbi:ABC transporter substrate-binding protein [Natronosporangium hydrolyticum]|uniref:ABC transporter substrate-binding protein n=1 Tax=Natronosporangium hydrolyticum TaxID=2811111 RepID=UPI001EFA0B51|nr:ABC transporter substrate-binding protein [Natronosporangium hydrolyticum]